TKFVLNHFGIKPPAFADTLEPKAKNVAMRRIQGVDAETSLYMAWQKMEENNTPSLPVLENNSLIGIITRGDVARNSMEHDSATALSDSAVKCRNIVETLAGELIVGDPEKVFDEGEVLIGASNDEKVSHIVRKHAMVILGNRSGAMLSAIEGGAEWLIVCLEDGENVSKLIKTLAEDNGCTIIVTPYDTFTVARLINQSMPVRQVMSATNLVTVHENDLVSEIREVMTKMRLRYFPVLDRNEKYIGLLSQRNLLDMEPQKVVMVDHNEATQAVDGIEFCEIIEVIDHHRIGSIQTMQPINFRNMPLGCTATIITMMYHEAGVEIDKKIAGILCSAILSDTLCFRSPTCTPIDKAIAKELAIIAEIDPEEFATEMFRAGSNHDGQTEEEVFYADFKTFNSEDKKLGISQVSVIGKEDTDKLMERMRPYLKEVMDTTHLDMVFLMFTDVMQESSRLIFLGEGTEEIVKNAFGCSVENNEAYLPGIVSRKKQTVPYISKAMQKMNEQL
ncbi:MAG: putative manganese-dependent inorganic diphosphatase, partial [Clostridia bacterium]|nr:putative manganese-dependent inorganic diphosphatase [Clostridia bacterium]